ncbi:uncharacterized protein LOC105357460 isoform X3 [Oryzias latipes]|uniref:uncharacterized protein LOC105357460 isoform X3 n=1 Tax=Oryzias latipes TaxID=8090 RepID=UPI000CE21625|nr:uncharacterized protein LOC105357460 isoform X3 [Oryzias latipes]
MTIQVLFFTFVLTGGGTLNPDFRDPQARQLVSNGTTEFSSGDFGTFELDYPNLGMAPLPPEAIDPLEIRPEHFNRIFKPFRDTKVDVSYECSYQSVLNKLNLKENSDKYVTTRPVADHRHLTCVFVEMRIYAIMDVDRAG